MSCSAISLLASRSTRVRDRTKRLGYLAIACVLSCARQPTTTSLPRFDGGLMLEAIADESANASIGDLNGDGNLDIVLVKGRHSPRVDKVLFGDGQGAFPVVRDLSAMADRSYSGSLVDVDRDGDLDVVISNDAPDPKVVHVNDGAGRFSVHSTYGEARWVTRNAAVTDMNRDGLPDIVLANRASPGSNYICLNEGNGKFGADCVLFSREPATTITAADFNRDGFTDLVVPNRDGGQSYVYMHEGKPGMPTFTRVPFGPARVNVRVSGVGDFDGDGRLDVVTADERVGVALYFGESTGWSLPFMISEAPKAISSVDDLPRGAPYALLVADVNRDGKPDVLVGKVQAPSTLHVNDGSGRRFVEVQFGDSGGTAYGFAVGDVNKDGRTDVAVARSGAANILFLAIAR